MESASCAVKFGMVLKFDSGVYKKKH